MPRPIPKQRTSRDENDDVKAGETPEAWGRKPAKSRQKDKDAKASADVYADGAYRSAETEA
jgi:hypothetical protein